MLKFICVSYFVFAVALFCLHLCLSVFHLIFIFKIKRCKQNKLHAQMYTYLNHLTIFQVGFKLSMSPIGHTEQKCR